MTIAPKGTRVSRRKRAPITCACGGCRLGKECTLPVATPDVAARSTDPAIAVGAHTLAMVVAVLSVDAGAWFGLDRRGRVTHAVAHDPVPWEWRPIEALRAYAREFRRVDPFLRPDNRGPVRPVLTDSTLPSQVDFSQLAYNRHYIAQIGLAHVANVHILRHGEPFGQFWVGRRRQGAGFDRADVHLLDRVRLLLEVTVPHLPLTTIQPPISVRNLTEREREVARVAATGAPNSRIAAALSIAEGTVRTHMYNIFTKLGVKNRAQLIRQIQDGPSGGDHVD